MKISIGESRQKKWKFFSRATEVVEGVGHSHIFVSWKDKFGLRWVAEARGGGTRIVSNKEFKSSSEVVGIYHYHYEDASIEKQIVEYVWDRAGKRYGFLQILGLLVMRAKNWWSREVTGRSSSPNPFRDGDASQICCEFAIHVAALTSPDIRVPEDLDSYGLVETRKFNEFFGKKQPQDLVDRINGNAH